MTVRELLKDNYINTDKATILLDNGAKVYNDLYKFYDYPVYKYIDNDLVDKDEVIIKIDQHSYNKLKLKGVL